MFFAVIDRATGRVEGRQAIMRIDAANGVAEIGHIMWGPAMTRSRIATEAFFLTADLLFGLGYRRFEWKCHHGNEPSKRAALRFGFQHEGTFRNHLVIKGANRNTEWFSIIDEEWPRLREGYVRWLAPGTSRRPASSSVASSSRSEAPEGGGCGSEGADPRCRSLPAPEAADPLWSRHAIRWPRRARDAVRPTDRVIAAALSTPRDPHHRGTGPGATPGRTIRSWC